MFRNPYAKQVQHDFLLWLPVGLIPIANALIRLSVYQDDLGDIAAGWVSASLDVAFVLIYANLIARTPRVGLRAATWTVCTTGLHFGLGIFIFGSPVSALVGKYDLSSGEPWLLVTVAIAVSPWIADRIRKAMASRRAQLLVLVGPKGAGKSEIGRMIESRFNAHFVDVERIAIRVLRSMGGIIDETYARRAFEDITHAIRAVETDHAAIVIETTGASDETVGFLDRLSSRYEVCLIKIGASAETCAERVRTRNQSKQISVSDDLIRTMHARSEALALPWNIEIDNDRKCSVDEIESLVRPHIRAVRVADATNGTGGPAMRSMNAGGIA